MMQIRPSFTVDGLTDCDGNAVVLVDRVRLSPGRSLRVLSHSPSGFSWGYGGSGPAQLALAILLEAGMTDTQARAYHHKFKEDFVRHWPDGHFSVRVDLAGWLGIATPIEGSTA